MNPSLFTNGECLAEIEALIANDELERGSNERAREAVHRFYALHREVASLRCRLEAALIQLNTLGINEPQAVLDPGWDKED